MDTILAAILEAVLMTVMAVPGILIRWVLHWGKVPLKKLADDRDVWYNASYTALLIVAVIAVKQFVLKV